MIIGYLRVSTKEQNVAAQRQVIQDKYQIERWYEDQAASGAVKALNRPEFRKMAEFVRQGDTVVVVAIDRLGRNTIDVLETVQFLQKKGVGSNLAPGKLRFGQSVRYGDAGYCQRICGVGTQLHQRASNGRYPQC